MWGAQATAPRSAVGSRTGAGRRPLGSTGSSAPPERRGPRFRTRPTPRSCNPTRAIAPGESTDPSRRGRIGHWRVSWAGLEPSQPTKCSPMVELSSGPVAKPKDGELAADAGRDEPRTPPARRAASPRPPRRAPRRYAKESAGALLPHEWLSTVQTPGSPHGLLLRESARRGLGIVGPAVIRWHGGAAPGARIALCHRPPRTLASRQQPAGGLEIPRPSARFAPH